MLTMELLSEAADFNVYDPPDIKSLTSSPHGKVALAIAMSLVTKEAISEDVIAGDITQVKGSHERALTLTMDDIEKGPGSSSARWLRMRIVVLERHHQWIGSISIVSTYLIVAYSSECMLYLE